MSFLASITFHFIDVMWEEQLSWMSIDQQSVGWRKSTGTAMCHINRHPLLLFLSITIPEFQPCSVPVGFIYSENYKYPFFVAVGPGTTQPADTNNMSCPFVLHSADPLSLRLYPLSYLCKQRPHLTNLLVLPGDYENQETSLRLV